MKRPKIKKDTKRARDGVRIVLKMPYKAYKINILIFSRTNLGQIFTKNEQGFYSLLLLFTYTNLSDK